MRCTPISCCRSRFDNESDPVCLVQSVATNTKNESDPAIQLAVTTNNDSDPVCFAFVHMQTGEE